MKSIDSQFIEQTEQELFALNHITKNKLVTKIYCNIIIDYIYEHKKMLYYYGKYKIKLATINLKCKTNSKEIICFVRYSTLVIKKHLSVKI